MHWNWLSFSLGIIVGAVGLVILCLIITIWPGNN